MTNTEFNLKSTLTRDLLNTHSNFHQQPELLKGILVELKYRKKAASKCKTWTRFQIRDWMADGNTKEFNELVKSLPKTGSLSHEPLIFDIYKLVGMYSWQLTGTAGCLHRFDITDSNKITKTASVLRVMVSLHLTMKRMLWRKAITKVQSSIQQHSLTLQKDVDSTIQEIERLLQHP